MKAIWIVCYRWSKKCFFWPLVPGWMNEEYSQGDSGVQVHQKLALTWGFSS